MVSQFSDLLGAWPKTRHLVMMTVIGSEIEFKAYEQHQESLPPRFVRDALDPADPVFFIDDMVDGMGLTAFGERYAVQGEHAYSPRLLLMVWLF